ncbi:MAG TPA: hypothetical protein VK772_09330 [Puia sp.]|jgi:hypothetical protein|nr:hypothetical protein [Puia sp.]
MYKKYILSALALGLSGFGFSQTFMQGLGVNLIMQSLPGYSVMPVVGIIYSPKFTFFEKEHSSLSLGLPVSTAYAGNYDTQAGNENNKTIGWMLDAPLMINYNYGTGSNKKNSGRFGFFAGIGYGYHCNPFTDNSGDDVAHVESGFGPVFNTGIRIARDPRHNFEIRFSYMKATDVSKSDIYSIGGIFNW